MNSLYGIPVSGMQGANFTLDVAANDIANVNTSGFQAVTSLLESLPAQSPLTDPTNAADANTQNRVGMGVRPGATERSQAQASLQATGNPLDLALTGPNYFALSAPNGQLVYAQQVSLHLQPDGTLVTDQGLTLNPSLRVPPQVVRVSVDAHGVVTGETLSGRRTQVGTLRTVTFAAPENLQAQGGGLYTETVGSGRPQQTATGTVPVYSGYQLGSTVDLATEMVNVIQAQGQFTASAKALQTLDSLIGTVVNLQAR